MQPLHAMTFKQKQAILKNVFDEYQRAKAKLHCLEMNNFYPGINYQVVRETKQTYQYNNMETLLHSHIDNVEELRGIIQSFEYIISLLSKESQRIIENEFMKQAAHDWWREYYAKSTYYRVKTRAMEEMLFYLNSI